MGKGGQYRKIQTSRGREGEREKAKKRGEKIEGREGHNGRRGGGSMGGHATMAMLRATIEAVESNSEFFLCCCLISTGGEMLACSLCMRVRAASCEASALPNSTL